MAGIADPQNLFQMTNQFRRQHVARRYDQPDLMEARIRRNIGRGRGPHATLGRNVQMTPREMLTQEQAALNMHRNVLGAMEDTADAMLGPGLGHNPFNIHHDADVFPGDEQSLHDDIFHMRSQAAGQAQAVIDNLNQERLQIGDDAMHQQERIANVARAQQAQRAAALPQAAPAAEAETAVTGLADLAI